MHEALSAGTPLKGALLGVALALAAPASAQLAMQAFQIIIQRAGNSCQAIETTQAIGTGSNGDALVAVACANGERHVVCIHKDNSVSYMTGCNEFEQRTGLACFGGR